MNARKNTFPYEIVPYIVSFYYIYSPNHELIENHANGFTFLLRAESIAIAFTASKGKLLAFPYIGVIVPFLEPTQTRPNVFGHAAHILVLESTTLSITLLFCGESIGITLTT